MDAQTPSRREQCLERIDAGVAPEQAFLESGYGSRLAETESKRWWVYLQVPEPARAVKNVPSVAVDVRTVAQAPIVQDSPPVAPEAPRAPVGPKSPVVPTTAKKPAPATVRPNKEK